MRAGFTYVCALVFAVFAAAQTPQSDDWRSALMELPEHPTANLQDFNRFERQLTMAMPYFATLKPGDYEANREIVRRIIIYQAGLDMLYRNPQVSRDPLMRSTIGRMRNVIGQMRSYGIFMSMGMQMGGTPQPAPSEEMPKRAAQSAGAGRHEPPFALVAPRLDHVAPADSKIASELCALYDTNAARAAAAWQSAETLRTSLENQGMSLNTQTAASLSRLQLYFDSAATALRESDWAEARSNLERAGYETEKIFKTVGR